MKNKYSRINSKFFYHGSEDTGLILDFIDFSRKTSLDYPTGLAVTQKEQFEGREWADRTHRYELCVSGNVLDMRKKSTAMEVAGQAVDYSAKVIDRIAEQEDIGIIYLNSKVQVITKKAHVSSFRRIR